MGAALTGLALTSGLGCSFLYDSATLDDYIEPPEDMSKPANPDALTVDAIAAAPALEEGYGDGGSRPAVLVLEGSDFTPETTVAITAPDGSAIPGLTVADLKVSRGHTRLAMTVSVLASNALVGGMDYPLLITVTKPDAVGNPITQTKNWVLKGRHELTMGGMILAEGVGKPHIYSKVDVTAAITVQGNQPLVMRSNSSFRIVSNLDVSAAGKNGGVAGGANGGASAAGGGGPSGGTGGTAGLAADGGGAGYATEGAGGAQAASPVGDAQITTFAANTSSGGGGGATLLGALGGSGGGGGGAIELSARSELIIANITSNGAGGSAGLLNAGNGGGGSGGTIVLRSGTKLTAGTISAAGGSGGSGTSNKGAEGRIRVDAAEIGSGNSVPLAVRGAMFDPATPTTVSLADLKLKIFSTPGTRFDLHAFDASGQSILAEPVLVDFQGAPDVTVTVKLIHGYNLLCTTPTGSTISKSESTNCFEVAYVDDNK